MSGRIPGSLYRDGFVVFGAHALANLCLFASALVATRIFAGASSGSDGYFRLVALVTLGSILSHAGLPTALVKTLAAQGGSLRRSPALAQKAFVATLATGLFAATLVGVYSQTLSRDPFAAESVSGLVVCLVSGSLSKGAAALLMGSGRLRLAAGYEALLEVLRFGALLGWAQRGEGADSLAVAWAGVGGVHALIGGWGVIRIQARDIPEASRPGAGAFEKASRISRDSSGGRYGSWVPSDFVSLIRLSTLAYLPFAAPFAVTQGLVLWLSETGETGVASQFAVSLQLASVMLLLVQPAITVLLPHFSRAVSSRAVGIDEAPAPQEFAYQALAPASRQAKALTFRLLGLLGVGALAFMALADPLARAIFPAQPLEAWGLRVLALVYCLEALKSVWDPFLIGVDRAKSVALAEGARVACVGAGIIGFAGRADFVHALALLCLGVLSAAAWKLWAWARMPRFGKGRTQVPIRSAG